MHLIPNIRESLLPSVLLCITFFVLILDPRQICWYVSRLPQTMSLSHFVLCLFFNAWQSVLHHMYHARLIGHRVGGSQFVYFVFNMRLVWDFSQSALVQGEYGVGDRWDTLVCTCSQSRTPRFGWSASVHGFLCRVADQCYLAKMQGDVCCVQGCLWMSTFKWCFDVFNGRSCGLECQEGCRGRHPLHFICMGSWNQKNWGSLQAQFPFRFKNKSQDGGKQTCKII